MVNMILCLWLIFGKLSGAWSSTEQLLSCWPLAVGTSHLQNPASTGRPWYLWLAHSDMCADISATSLPAPMHQKMLMEAFFSKYSIADIIMHHAFRNLRHIFVGELLRLRVSKGSLDAFGQPLIAVILNMGTFKSARFCRL